jgi:hypothetical protein
MSSVLCRLQSSTSCVLHNAVARRQFAARRSPYDDPDRGENETASRAPLADDKRNAVRQWLERQRGSVNNWLDHFNVRRVRAHAFTTVLAHRADPSRGRKTFGVCQACRRLIRTNRLCNDGMTVVR